MATKRIYDLTNATSLNASDKVPVDRSGGTARSILATDFANAVRPFASTLEAQTGTATDKTMTPAASFAAWDAKWAATTVVTARIGDGQVTSPKLASGAAAANLGATAAQLRDRTTHTGTQAISTITNLQASLDAKLSAVAPGSITDVELSDSLAAVLTGRAATRTALKALSTTRFTSIYLTEAGREGLFVWRSGDYSALVTADTQEGIYIKANAVAASLGAWVRQYDGDVEASWFGVDGTGSGDDAAKLTVAQAVMGPDGGTLRLPEGLKRILSNFTIAKNINLVDNYVFPGRNGTNLTENYNVMSRLAISGSVTVTLDDGASVSGMLVVKDGLTFPVANHTTAYTGTAFTSAGDDVLLEKVKVLGFAKAYYSSGYQRPRLIDFVFDTINGVEITNCLDVPHLVRCHGWPYGTIQAVSAGWQEQLARSGIAFYLHDTVDWGKLEACFSFGYRKGTVIHNANSTTIVNIGHDNVTSGTPLHTNSVGIEVTGTSYDTKIIAPQLAANQFCGIYINTNPDLLTVIQSPTFWGGSTHAVLVEGGDVQIIGGGARDVSYALSVTNANSNVTIDGVRCRNIAGQPIQSTVGTGNVVIGPNMDFGNFAGAPISANVNIPTIASAGTMNLPVRGDFFFVSGTTTITTIGRLWAGRKVTLLFGGVLTVTHGAPITLKGGVNRTTFAGSTMEIIGTGASTCSEV